MICSIARLDLDYSSLVSNKNAYCKNGKGLKRRRLTIFRFFPLLSGTFAGGIFVKRKMEYSRSNLAFKIIHDNFIFGMLYLE